MHPYLTILDISARWGVSKSVVYQLVAAGRLPALRIGAARGTIRVKVEAVEAFERDSARVEPLKRGRRGG